MKYSVVGHSCIQNVDDMHSNIEKALLANFVFADFTKLSRSKTVQSYTNVCPVHAVDLN